MHPGCLWAFKHDYFIKAHEAAFKCFTFWPSNLTAESSKVWDGSRGGSGGSVEPPKVKRTQTFWPYF